MTSPPKSLSIVSSAGFGDYALLDCGAGRKLERFGKIVVDRPEAQALWQPVLPKAEWAKAHAVFSASGEDDEKGRWRIDKPVPEAWPVTVDGVTNAVQAFRALASGTVSRAAAALALDAG